MSLWWPDNPQKRHHPSCSLQNCSRTVGETQDIEGRTYCPLHRSRPDGEVTRLLREARARLDNCRAHIASLSSETSSGHPGAAIQWLDLALDRIDKAIEGY